jgi:hypothetical protein
MKRSEAIGAPGAVVAERCGSQLNPFAGVGANPLVSM